MAWLETPEWVEEGAESVEQQYTATVLDRKTGETRQVTRTRYVTRTSYRASSLTREAAKRVYEALLRSGIWTASYRRDGAGGSYSVEYSTTWLGYRPPE